MMNAQSTDALAAFRVTGRPGGTLLLRLTVQSRLVAPAVVEPVVDDWLADDGGIFQADCTVTPAYTYLRPAESAGITLRCVLPQTTSTSLRSLLRIPGVDDTVLPLQLSLAAEEVPEVSEHLLTVALPLAGYDLGAEGAGATNAAAVMKLLGGLAGLEVIPARWVTAELILTVCEVGEAYAQTEEGRALLDRLARTRFFKNGVLAFRGAYLVEWLLLSVTVSSGLHQTLGGAPGQGRMLGSWLRWLVGLMDTDLERFDEEASVHLASQPVEETLRRLGNDPETWFGALVLGLTRLSPKVEALVEQVAAAAPPLSPASPETEAAPADVLAEPGSLQR